MKLFCSFALTLLLTSCMPKHIQIKKISSSGLNYNLGFKSLLFVNNDTGFIAGSFDSIEINPDKKSDTFSFVKRSALLFRTTDGAKTWKRQEFGEGYFTQIAQVDNKLFAFKTSKNYTHVSIFFSDDLGESWKEQTLFPDRIEDILHVDNLFCAIGKDDKGEKTRLFISKDCLTWKGPYILKHSIFHNPVIYQKKLIYLSNNKSANHYPNELIEYNLQNNSIAIFEVPKMFKCYSLNSHDDLMKLCGKLGNHIAIYSFKGGSLTFEYSISGTDSLDFPEKFYNTKDLDMMVIGRQRNYKISYRILKTSNNGKKWETINFIKDSYIKPYHFLKDGNNIRAYFYSGSDIFQVLEQDNSHNK